MTQAKIVPLPMGREIKIFVASTMAAAGRPTLAFLIASETVQKA